MTAASSISGESCIMADKDEREEKGMYFTEPQIIMRTIAPTKPPKPTCKPKA